MSKKQKTTGKADPVEVYCRIRPINENDERCLKIIDESTLMMQIPDCSAAYRSGQIKQLVYSFSHVFDDTTTQRQMFDQVASSLVQDLVNGKNGLLFTYGVTGSGKTYSMIGNQHECGILQRSLDTIFNSISSNQAKKYIFKPDKSNWFEVQSEADASLDRQREQQMRISYNNQFQTPNSKMNNLKNQQLQLQQLNALIEIGPDQQLSVNINKDNMYSVFISCIEIYNNYIYDLLDEIGVNVNQPTSSAQFGQQNQQQQLFDNMQNKESKYLKEDNKGCMYIKDVNEMEVKSIEEALDLLNKAQKRRVVAHTDLNSESSRSHSIFTIRLVQTSSTNVQNMSNKGSSSAPVCVSQLSLVDLAGSERTKRTKNTGSRLREAGSINSSLMALRNCMETLRENSLNGLKKMVPYRDSKLTLLFKNYFEGNGKIKMILCINPSSIEFDETFNVLKFSELVRDVLVPSSDNNNFQQGKIVKSSSVNANLNFKITLDELENANFVILNNLQKNNYSIMNESVPPLDIFSPHDDVTIIRLIDYLEEFQRRRDTLIQELNVVKQNFHYKFRELGDEYDKLKDERNFFKGRLEQKEKDQAKFDSKIKALEKIINTNNSCQRTPMSQSQPSQQQPSSAVSSNGGSCERNQCLPPLTLSNSAGSGSGSNVSNPNETPMGFRSNRIIQNTNSALRNATNTNSNPTPSSGRTIGSIINSAAYNKYQTPSKASSNQASNVNPRDGIPIANRRAARRSKSAEMWLDHKPPFTTKTDTVLQPKMNRKKSVSKVEINDALKSSKYLLTHQQQDQNGDIRTNLIKGDILKSPSGGANIIFTEVETLEVKAQEQPKPLKRSCDGSSIEDKNLIEERCSFAIEGHSSKSKLLRT